MNKTQIYDNYEAFLKREYKDLNGVSPEFAKDYPNWEKANSTNKACWNCSRCSDCYDCYDCSRCSRCSRCYDCYDCSRCCSRCSGCSGCSGCYDCYDCSDCSDKKGEKGEGMKVPIIKDIHSALLKAVSGEKALDMSVWHKCDTTHCRAGWIVTLAGEEGKALEKQTSSLFAAMQIYHKSSPIKVSPVRFFDSNEKAMEDIKRCAKEEKASK